MNKLKNNRAKNNNVALRRDISGGLSKTVRNFPRVYYRIYAPCKDKYKVAG